MHLILCGSMDGEQPVIIELFAFGAIASKCAFLFPVPFMSGHSPFCFASLLVCSKASSFIFLNTSSLSVLVLVIQMAFYVFDIKNVNPSHLILMTFLVVQNILHD